MSYACWPVIVGHSYLAELVLSHTEFEFHEKSMYLAYMSRQCLLAKADPSLLDDKDYYGNKRLELAAPPPLSPGPYAGGPPAPPPFHAPGPEAGVPNPLGQLKACSSTTKDA